MGGSRLSLSRSVRSALKRTNAWVVLSALLLGEKKST